MKPGVTLGDAHALNDLLGASWRHTGQCGSSYPHASQHGRKMEELSAGDTLGGVEALVNALADTLGEVEALTPGDTIRDAHALNDLLGDTCRHTWHAEALVVAMADTLPEVEAVTPGDTLGDAYALNDLLGDRLRHTGQCGGSVEHAGL